jgi:hypothetical protein
MLGRRWRVGERSWLVSECTCCSVYHNQEGVSQRHCTLGAHQATSTYDIVGSNVNVVDALPSFHLPGHGTAASCVFAST